MGPTSREDFPQKEQVVMRRPRKPPPPPPEPPPPPGFAPPAVLPAGGPEEPPPLPVPEPPFPVRLLFAMLERLAFPFGPQPARSDTRAARPTHHFTVRGR